MKVQLFTFWGGSRYGDLQQHPRLSVEFALNLSTRPGALELDSTPTQPLTPTSNPTPTSYSPARVDRIWGIGDSYCNIPKTIVYLLKEEYKP